MTKLNLGQDWELRADAANNRLLAEYTPNGTQFEMNGDGTLRPLNGGIDLGGADITNAGSVSTNTVEVDNYELREFSATVADDNAVSFDGEGVKLVNVLGGRASAQSGIFGSSFNSVYTYGAQGMSNEGQSALSGSTGPDGSLNISRDGNTIYVENRTDSQQRLVVVLHKAL